MLISTSLSADMLSDGDFYFNEHQLSDDVADVVIVAALPLECRVTQLGEHYHGHAHSTRTGKLCQQWNKQEVRCTFVKHVCR